jgi:hypothetical protein
MTFPIDGPAPDTLLRRTETAAALTTVGYRISGPSLANLASRGSGPPFKKFGKTALYRWGDALSWAEARTSPARVSTAEHRVALGTAIKPKASRSDLGLEHEPKNAA